MKLDEKSRLILINQYKILNKLDNTDEYNNWIEILEKGYENRYIDILLQLSGPVDKTITDFVCDVLDMFRDINAYKLDNPNDIELDKHHYSVFAGFDQRDDAQYFYYADFLINKEDRWKEFKNIQLNSHSSNVNIYSRMIEIWNKYKSPTLKLTKIQINEILSVVYINNSEIIKEKIDFEKLN
jgi:uncharacterized protein